MVQRRLTFEAPPVIEVVLGVQFEPLKLSSGHMGWFWKTALDDLWPSAVDAPRLLDQFERFESRQFWRMPKLGLQLEPVANVNRLQISNAPGDRMIQVQDTRFIYNWIKKSAAYPTYETLRPEFDKVFAAFKRFVEASDGGTLVPNQWEVAYVNHIPAGELWMDIVDWSRVIPGLIASPPFSGPTKLEAFGGEWRSIIGDKAGRLHALVRRQMIEKEAGEAIDTLVFNLTARGPVNREHGLGTGLDLGHDAIVDTFEAVTSSAAHLAWKKRD